MYMNDMRVIFFTGTINKQEDNVNGGRSLLNAALREMYQT